VTMINQSENYIICSVKRNIVVAAAAGGGGGQRSSTSTQRKHLQCTVYQDHQERIVADGTNRLELSAELSDSLQTPAQNDTFNCVLAVTVTEKRL